MEKWLTTCYWNLDNCEDAKKSTGYSVNLRYGNKNQFLHLWEAFIVSILKQMIHPMISFFFWSLKLSKTTWMHCTSTEQ